MSSNKKLFIQTLGCQMNDTDSQHMQAELEKHKGYTATQNIEEADLIIINTCSVRENPFKDFFLKLANLIKRKKWVQKLE